MYAAASSGCSNAGMANLFCAVNGVATKPGLTILTPIGIGVSVVNPGFVATPLTAQNKFAMPALLQPEEAATYMLKGWADGEFEIHYPKRFSRWLKLIRLLPYRWYFGLVRSATKI